MGLFSFTKHEPVGVVGQIIPVSNLFTVFVLMFCAICYHLLLACNITKSSTPPWVFFTFFKLYNWYQIAQHITFGFWFLILRIFSKVTFKLEGRQSNSTRCLAGLWQPILLRVSGWPTSQNNRNTVINFG